MSHGAPPAIVIIKYAGAPFAFKYWWGSGHQLEKGEKKKRDKKNRGMKIRRKREKKNRGKKEKAERRKDE